MSTFFLIIGALLVGYGLGGWLGVGIACIILGIIAAFNES